MAWTLTKHGEFYYSACHVEELRGIPSGEFVNGMRVWVTGLGEYQMDTSESSADDGSLHIKPFDVDPADPARWVLIDPWKTATGFIGYTPNSFAPMVHTHPWSAIVPGAWKMFYSDGTPAVQELSLVSAGRFLLTAGASSAPAFEAAAKLYFDTTDVRLGVGQATPAATVDSMVSDAATGVSYALYVEHKTSSTSVSKVAGTGTGIKFLASATDGGTPVDHGAIVSRWINKTPGAYDSMLGFATVNAAGTLQARVRIGLDGLTLVNAAGKEVTLDPSAAASDIVYTLPADNGDPGEVLVTDGSGVLSWEPAGAPLSHAMTSHTAGNWKVFYSDGAASVQELALGAQYKVLMSNSASSAPSFELLTNNNLAASGTANIAWNKLAASANKGYAVITDAGTGYLTTEQYLAVGRGGTGTGALTAGSVVFAGVGGVYSQDNAKLFWDDSNKRLGVGNAAPAYPLDVTGVIRNTSDARLGGDVYTKGATVSINRLNNGAGNRFASVDLVGDDTYTTYGARFIRENTGANASTNILHRGTGALSLYALDAGSVQMITGGTIRLAVSPTGSVTVASLVTNGPMYAASGVLSSEQYLDETRGGTGRGTWVKGDLVYASNTNELGAITAVTAGRFLVSNGATTAPYYPAQADIYWDETNNRLGLGMAAQTPKARLTLGWQATTDRALVWADGSTAGAPNYICGFGIQDWISKEYWPSNYTKRWGTMAVADGTTWAEMMQLTTGGRLQVGVATSGSDQYRVCAYGSDTGGNAIGVAAWNIADHNSAYATFRMASGAAGTKGGLFFGSRAALAPYGIANGVTFGPIDATQDIGFRVGTDLSGGATGPTVLIDSNKRMKIGQGSTAPATKLHIYDENATTNAVLDVLTIDRGVTGAGVGAAGLGAGIVLRLENGKVGGGVMTEAGRIETVMTTVTDGSEYSEINFKRRYNGSMETLLSIGSGIYGNSAVCIRPTSGPGELAFTHDSTVSLVQEDVTGNLFLWGEESAAGVMTYWDRVNDYIGILTDSPAYPLDVHGVIHNDADILCGGTLLTVGPAIEVGQLGTGYRTSYVDLTGDSSTYSDYGDRWIRWGGAVAHVNAATDLVHRGTGLFRVVNQEAANMEFLTTNTTRMTITSAGLVGVGTTAPPYEFSVAAIADDAQGFDFAPLVQTIGGRGGTGGYVKIQAEGPGDATGAGITLYGSTNAIPDAIRFWGNEIEYGRFTTAGDFGIGTAIPVSMLEVFKSDISKNVATVLTLTHDANSGDANHGVAMAFSLSDSAGNTPQNVAKITGQWASATSGAEYGRLKFGICHAGAIRDSYRLEEASGSLLFYQDAHAANDACGGYLMTGGVKRFAPYVGGAAGAYWALEVEDNAGASIGNAITVQRADMGVKMGYRLTVANRPVYSGYYARWDVSSSGAADGIIGANSSSDVRLKTNVRPISSEMDVLARLDELRGVYFNWIDCPRNEGLSLDQRQVGCIAQEVREVLPEVIMSDGERDPDEILGVDYMMMVPYLLECLKALKARVEKLEGR